MVAEPWILKMGNQVSTNLKHALYPENLIKSANKKQGFQERRVIGILSFEIAKVMSKIIYLFKTLTDHEIAKLKNEILKSEGIKSLVSNDERILLELAFVEKLDDLNTIASVLSMLGKKCSIPALQGFEHVYRDILSGVIDTKELSFLVKDMDGMMRKMERYVNSTATLYSEMEVMNQIEIATKKFQQNQHEESWKAFEQRLTWKKQDVRHLMDVSLWNQTYDKVVELLARTVCTLYARIHLVFRCVHPKEDTSTLSRERSDVTGCFRGTGSEFGNGASEFDVDPKVQVDNCLKKSVSTISNDFSHSLPTGKKDLQRRGLNFKPKGGLQKSGGRFGPEDFSFACAMGPGRMLMECLSLSNAIQTFDDDVQTRQIPDNGNVESRLKVEHSNLLVNFGHTINGDQMQCRDSFMDDPRHGLKNPLLVKASPSTLGGSALALHYANVIIVIEKLLCYPHLVGDEARDDLYQMLPTSLKKNLKTNLKSYAKNLAIYDAPIAHDWRERLDRMLLWLSPLAHSMIRWQSERNFEQRQIITRKNVLLLQTLYFADREKTEAAICELLVGLNYMCRYEQQQNALLECTSSFEIEDSMEWSPPH